MANCLPETKLINIGALLFSGYICGNITVILTVTVGVFHLLFC